MLTGVPVCSKARDSAKGDADALTKPAQNTEGEGVGVSDENHKLLQTDRKEAHITR